MCSSCASDDHPQASVVARRQHQLVQLLLSRQTKICYLNIFGALVNFLTILFTYLFFVGFYFYVYACIPVCSVSIRVIYLFTSVLYGLRTERFHLLTAVHYTKPLPLGEASAQLNSLGLLVDQVVCSATHIDVHCAQVSKEWVSVEAIAVGWLTEHCPPNTVLHRFCQSVVTCDVGWRMYVVLGVFDVLWMMVGWLAASSVLVYVLMWCVSAYVVRA